MAFEHDETVRPDINLNESKLQENSYGNVDDRVMEEIQNNVLESQNIEELPGMDIDFIPPLKFISIKFVKNKKVSQNALQEYLHT